MTTYRYVLYLSFIFAFFVGLTLSYMFYNEQKRSEMKLVHLTCNILELNEESKVISFRCLEN
jgi:hypothetical protein